MQSSAEIFRANLEQLLAKHGNYENFARFLKVPVSTLKSWINGTRTPSLQATARLANQLGCPLSELITPHAHLTDRGIQHNDAHKFLVQNLKIIFIDKQCYSLPQKLFLLEHEVSEFALKSYLRNSSFRLPTLAKLDEIAKTLRIPAYELLKEEPK